MSLFELTIVSESEIIYSGKASYCGITTLSGAIGFKANHEAFTAVLKTDSEVEYTDSSSNPRKLPVKNGLFSFKDNKCSVTVSR